MKNPYLHIIGHPDDARYEVDYLALVQSAKEHRVLLEVNNNSLDPPMRQTGRRRKHPDHAEIMHGISGTCDRGQ